MSACKLTQFSSTYWFPATSLFQYRNLDTMVQILSLETCNYEKQKQGCHWPIRWQFGNCSFSCPNHLIISSHKDSPMCYMPMTATSIPISGIPTNKSITKNSDNFNVSQDNSKRLEFWSLCFLDIVSYSIVNVII